MKIKTHKLMLYFNILLTLIYKLFNINIICKIFFISFIVPPYYDPWLEFVTICLYVFFNFNMFYYCTQYLLVIYKIF